MSKVKIGILGCAKIAEKYSIKAFQAIENAEVVSIASRNQDKAREWAARFGIGKAETYDALISNAEVDAIYIPLPIGLHREWIIKATQNKKHVLCEKSLAENFAATKDAVSTAEKNNVILYENFMCDFHPQHKAVLDLISEGKIGEPFIFQSFFGCPPLSENNIRYNQELGGGALNDMGCYPVFMARKILGGEPKAVTASLSRDRKKLVDTGGTAMLEFEDRREALIAFSMNAVYQNNYSVWGSKGLVNVARAYSIPADMKPIVELVTNENNKESTENLNVPAVNHFELIFRDFCDTIINKNKKSEKIKETYKTILNQARLLEAIRVSSAQNKKILLSKIN